MPKDEVKSSVPVNPAPPPMRRGMRMIGDPLATIPPEVRDIANRMMAGKRKGPQVAGAPLEVGTTGTWGSNGASVDAAYGTIMSARLKRKAEREKYPDNNGETTAYLFYDFSYEGSFEALIQGSLEPGDSVSVGGQDLYVSEAEKQWEYKGWAKYSVSAEKHDGVSGAP
jgi:hypothetical protein